MVINNGVAALLEFLFHGLVIESTYSNLLVTSSVSNKVGQMNVFFLQSLPIFNLPIFILQKVQLIADLNGRLKQNYGTAVARRK